MGTATKTRWRLVGEEIASCNCAWGCPCQFNALPTHGRCEGLAAVQVHEANGIRQLIIDAQATPAQREALVALDSGAHGGAYWAIFAAVSPTALEPVVAPIHLGVDRERRRATVRIPEVGDI